MNTPMTLEAFGESLLKSGDLDPMYIAVNRAALPTEQLHRLMFSYFCFYHLGAAAKMSEAPTAKAYWEQMLEAAHYSPVKNPEAREWPRGAERRHYRGDQAIKSMHELVLAYAPGSRDRISVTTALQRFIGADAKPALTFSSVSRAVQTHRGFGEWIAFKVADVAERVLGYNVDFSDCHLGIYKDPRQGAAVAYVDRAVEVGVLHPDEVNGKPWDYPINDQQLKETVEDNIRYFSKIKALGLNRKVNVQEVETIFCKYKSHLKGHYPLGKDTREIGHGLIGWGKTADLLRSKLPKEVA